MTGAEGRVRRAERWGRWYDVTKLVLAAVAVVFGGAGLIVLLIVSAKADDQRARTVDLAETIASCTDTGIPDPGVTDPRQWAHPPGRCYLKALRRQAEVIGKPPGSINTVVVLAAACAQTSVRPGDVDADAQAATLACTVAALNRAAP